jgi:hypothetical protein
MGNYIRLNKTKVIITEQLAAKKLVEIFNEETDDVDYTVFDRYDTDNPVSVIATWNNIDILINVSIILAAINEAITRELKKGNMSIDKSDLAHIRSFIKKCIPKKEYTKIIYFRDGNINIENITRNITQCSDEIISSVLFNDFINEEEKEDE